jgi:RNA polymerase sigma-70 factor (ECF subfamily)
MTEPDALMRRLEQAVASMDAVTREVFLAHRLDGLSYAELAKRRSLSVEQVEQHIAGAILHIDRELTAMERRGRG